MPITFNANEIFEMAEEIERNGAKFYHKAAENTKDKQTKQMLLDMANMEDGHLKIFQEMREQLSGQEKGWTIFDPDNQSALYLQAMADTRGYEGKITPTKELTDQWTSCPPIQLHGNPYCRNNVKSFSFVSNLISSARSRKGLTSSTICFQ